MTHHLGVPKYRVILRISSDYLEFSIPYFFAHIFCEFFSVFIFFRVSPKMVLMSRIFWVEVVTGIEMSHLSFQLVKIVIPPAVFNLHAH